MQYEHLGTSKGISQHTASYMGIQASSALPTVPEDAFSDTVPIAMGARGTATATSRQCSRSGGQVGSCQCSWWVPWRSAALRRGVERVRRTVFEGVLTRKHQQRGLQEHGALRCLEA